MWKLFPFFKWIWGLALGVIALGIGINVLSDYLRGESAQLDPGIVTFLQRYAVWILAGIGVLVLLTGLSWISHRRQKLNQAFQLFKPATKLAPEDLGFQILEPGQNPSPSRRPFYRTYIPRRATNYNPRSTPEADHVYTEADLAQSLRQGKGYVLIGPPLDGKSRSAFQVIVQMQGYYVVRPIKDQPLPSNNTFLQMRGKSIVLLLDDLNDYAQSTLDLRGLGEKLEQYADRWVVVATCRDGPEMGALREGVEGVSSASMKAFL